MEPNVYWKPHKKVLTRFNLLFSYQHPSLLFGGLDFNFLGHLRVLLTWTTLHRSIFVRPWFLSSLKFRYSEKAESLETSNHETLSSDVGLKREQKYPNMVWKKLTCNKLGGNVCRHFSSWFFDGRPNVEQSGICELREAKETFIKYVEN